MLPSKMKPLLLAIVCYCLIPLLSAQTLHAPLHLLVNCTRRGPIENVTKVLLFAGMRGGHLCREIIGVAQILSF